MGCHAPLLPSTEAPCWKFGIRSGKLSNDVDQRKAPRVICGCKCGAIGCASQGHTNPICTEWLGLFGVGRRQTDVHHERQKVFFFDACVVV